MYMNSIGFKVVIGMGLISLGMMSDATTPSDPFQAIDITSSHWVSQPMEPVKLDSQWFSIAYASATAIAEFLQKQAWVDKQHIQADERTNTIWVRATSQQLANIAITIDQLDIRVPQVQIAANIVAVNKDYSQILGTRLGIISRNLAENDAKIAPAIMSKTDRLQQELTHLGVVSQVNGMLLARLGSQMLLDLELTALEREGHGEVIASPRLMTANKQTASIQAGAEIPFEHSTSSGATAVTFKRAALSMEVTPQITPNNDIVLQLAVNQDAPSSVQVNGVPLINTKALQTQVLIGNGETIVLGGVTQQEEAQRQERVPLLSDLPIIGRLFIRQVTQFKREELLIFITPTIVEELR
ncbi:MAG: type IV pilus secretin PilQ [Legionellales bacterium]|nr:type IV pilus secretin PilQ [Legionellales bacterium]